jgi:outer membrane protein OmpA-like peptidoglycan-associated protein
MRNRFVIIPLLVLAVGAFSTACATKGFVKQRVGEVNSKVDSLNKSVEETQERTKSNEGRIGEVDGKAGAARTAADDAARAAGAADTRAGAAGSAASAAAAKADDLDRASRRLVYTVVLNDAEGNFKFGAAKLPDDAKAKIDAMVATLMADPKGAYFEIEGYTDSIGPKDVNQKLGLERADAVKRYLYEQYQIPLHKINVISYGAEKPVAPNTTKDGRAQNRRVVIKVLE